MLLKRLLGDMMRHDVLFTKEIFDQLYELVCSDPSHEEFGETIHYEPHFYVHEQIDYVNRAAWIANNYGDKRVCVAGAGFGFLVMELNRLGIEAFGVDCSPYIRRNMRWVGKDITLYPRDIYSFGTLQADVLVTESMVEMSDPLRVPQLSKFGIPVVHMVYPNFVWGEPVDSWPDIEPSHSWVDIETLELMW